MTASSFSTLEHMLTSHHRLPRKKSGRSFPILHSKTRPVVNYETQRDRMSLGHSLQKKLFLLQGVMLSHGNIIADATTLIYFKNAAIMENVSSDIFKVFSRFLDG